MKLIYFCSITIILFLFLPVSVVLADSCTPDPGYDYCYNAYYSYCCGVVCWPRIQFTDPRDITGASWQNPMVQEMYINVKVDGLSPFVQVNAYVWRGITSWDQTVCESWGCNGENIGYVTSYPNSWEGKYVLGTTGDSNPLKVAFKAWAFNIDYNYYPPDPPWCYSTVGSGWVGSPNYWNLDIVECTETSHCEPGEVCQGFECITTSTSTTSTSTTSTSTTSTTSTTSSTTTTTTVPQTDYCPPGANTEAGFRNVLKRALFDYFQNPYSAVINKNGIQDMLDFYLNTNDWGTADCSEITGIVNSALSISNSIIPKCSDGTEYGECSSPKPKYCYAGNLIDKCSVCGCDLGYNCESDACVITWFSDYDYRKLFSVGGSSSGLTNYQMQVTVHSGSGTDSGNDVYLNGHALNWPEDIVFTTSGDDELDYWIESYDANSASFWVELDSLPASSTENFYIYYGDATTSNIPSYDDTFTKDYGETGLVGLWHMDEGSPITPCDYSFCDSSGQENHGMFGSTHCWGSSDGGNWDGMDPAQSFSTGYSLVFGMKPLSEYGFISKDAEPIGAITISFWVKTDESQSSTFIYGTAMPGLGPGQYIMTMDNKLEWTVINDGSTLIDALSTTSAINDDKWHFVVFTWDGTTNTNAAKVYFDGVLEGEATATGTRSGAPIYDIHIGSDPGIQFNEFYGYFDEFRIYNRAMSIDEARAYYERRIYADPEPIISSWGSEQTWH